MIEVTEVDLNAAAEALTFWYKAENNPRYNFRKAVTKDHPFVQSYARHRIAALEEAAKVADRYDTGDMTREDQEARRIATAIRALKGPTNG